MRDGALQVVLAWYQVVRDSTLQVVLVLAEYYQYQVAKWYLMGTKWYMRDGTLQVVLAGYQASGT